MSEKDEHELFKLQQSVPWDTMTDSEKFQWMRKLLSCIVAMDLRIHHLEMRNNLLDRR